MRQKYFSGFTLIELMITLVVIGLLAAIAYPTYINQIQKTRRADGISSLLNLQSRFERCYTDSFSYTACVTTIGLPENSTDNYYQLNVINAATTASTYQLSATTQNQQTGDTDCNIFTVNNLGQQTATNASNADTTSTCWP